MRTLKLNEDLIKKEYDSAVYEISLLENEQPFKIEAGAVVKVVIVQGNDVLMNEELTVLDAEKGIVQLDLSSFIGNGTMEMEIYVKSGDKRKSFPSHETSQLVKIIKSLKDDSANPDILNEYEIIVKNIDDVLTELRAYKVANEADKTSMTIEINKKLNAADIDFLSVDDVTRLFNEG